MNWTTVAIFLVVLVVFYLLKRAGQVSATEAQQHLKNGALVIDVRSSAEFTSGHLKNAMNVPLDEVDTLIPRRIKDKNQVILLHCQSGMRSGAAKKKLKAIGYLNAHNLGSYSRAAQIVSQ